MQHIFTFQYREYRLSVSILKIFCFVLLQLQNYILAQCFDLLTFSSKMFFAGLLILTHKLFRVLSWYWILGPKVFNFYAEHFPSKQSKVDATSKKCFSNKFVASSLRRCLTWRLQPWTDMKNRLRLRLQCHICK